MQRKIKQGHLSQHRAAVRRAGNQREKATVNVALQHPVLSGVIVTAVATVLSVAATGYFQARQLEAGYALTTVQTRISTCIALSEHHKYYISDNEAQKRVVLDDGTVMAVSDNRERHVASINMARALDLCLVEGKSLSGLNRCITLRTTDGEGNFDPYISVIDTKSSKPPSEGGQWPGQRNPAC